MLLDHVAVEVVLRPIVRAVVRVGAEAWTTGCPPPARRGPRRARRPRRRPTAGWPWSSRNGLGHSSYTTRGTCSTKVSATRISAGTSGGRTGSLTRSTQRPFTKKAKRASVESRKSIICASTRVTANRRSGDRSANRRLKASDSSSMSPRPTRSSARSMMPSRVIDTSGHAPSTWAITQREVGVRAVHLLEVVLGLDVVAEVEGAGGEAVGPLVPDHVLGRRGRRPCGTGGRPPGCTRTGRRRCAAGRSGPRPTRSTRRPARAAPTGRAPWRSPGTLRPRPKAPPWVP